GLHVSDRVLAESGHVDACPRAALAAVRPEVDHGAVEDTRVRGGRLVASDGADLACRDGVRIEGVGVRTVKRRRRHAAKRWLELRYCCALRGAGEMGPGKGTEPFPCQFRPPPNPSG